MKKLLALLLAMTVLSGAALADNHESVLRHVVLFKFKEDATAAQIQEIEKAFGALPEQIDAIIDYEWGTSKTVEVDLAQGYTHCFLVTFKDKAGLEAYLPHPAHKAFVEKLKPILAEAHVFDYVPGE